MVTGTVINVNNFSVVCLFKYVLYTTLNNLFLAFKKYKRTIILKYLIINMSNGIF